MNRLTSKEQKKNFIYFYVIYLFVLFMANYFVVVYDMISVSFSFSIWIH